MNIKILDERTNSDMELNNVVNDEVTIVICKDGGVIVKGNSPVIDWSKGLQYPNTIHYPTPPFGPFIVQDCVTRA